MGAKFSMVTVRMSVCVCALSYKYWWESQIRDEGVCVCACAHIHWRGQ